MRTLYEWLRECELPDGRELNLDYLPARGGWSLQQTAAATARDILGNEYAKITLKLICRCYVTENSGRLAALENMEAVRTWIRENPPEDGRIRELTLPAPDTRIGSGTEDFSFQISITEYREE